MNLNDISIDFSLEYVKMSLEKQRLGHGKWHYLIES